MSTRTAWLNAAFTTLVTFCLLASGGALHHALAQDEPPAGPAGPLTSAEILADIETFLFLHQVSMTREQASRLVNMAVPVEEYLARQEAAQNAPEVIAVLMEFRAGAAQGLPVTRDMWVRLVEAQSAAAQRAGLPPGDPDADDPLWLLGLEVATAFVPSLSSRQLQGLVAADAREYAADLISDACRALGMTEDEWDAWLEHTLDDILAGVEAPLPDHEARLREFLGGLRGLTDAEVEGERQDLVSRLSVLLSAPLHGDAVWEEVAARRLAQEMVFNSHFLPCLGEYAEGAPQG